MSVLALYLVGLIASLCACAARVEGWLEHNGKKWVSDSYGRRYQIDADASDYWFRAVFGCVFWPFVAAPAMTVWAVRRRRAIAARRVAEIDAAEREVEKLLAEPGRGR